MNEILRYSELRKSVHGRLLFEIGTLAIHERHCVALSGRNGAGKSTLLRIIAGLEAPDSATVSYRGQDLSWRRASARLRGDVIYLHQQPYLFDRSVTDNIAYGLRLAAAAREISARCQRHWSGPASGTCRCAMRANCRVASVSGWPSPVPGYSVRGPAAGRADQQHGQRVPGRPSA